MKSAFKFSSVQTRNGLSQIDVRHLRALRREFGPKFAWAVHYLLSPPRSPDWVAPLVLPVVGWGMVYAGWVLFR